MYIKLAVKPLIDTGLCVMLLMWEIPLLGQVEGGCALEISTFRARNGTRLTAGCLFTGPKKASISRANPLPLALVKDLPSSKALCTGSYKLWSINSYYVSFGCTIK
jgi:hypothetical protein